MARFARLWPAHAATLILSVILLARPNATGTDPVVLFANVTMVHAWIPIWDYFFSYNSVSWSISTEAGFCLLFPLVLLNLEPAPQI